MPGHTHNHDHNHSHGSGKVLIFALICTAAFAAVEVVGGLWAGSLALLSDAGHMITDSSSLGIGAFAAWLATRPATREHSFGLQRAEVLGALVNVLFMFAVVLMVSIAAVQRLFEPAPVAGGTVMLIAFIGLVVNILVAWILMRGEQTMNVRGALLHVMGDLLGSVAALAAGTIIFFTGWTPADPILSLFVSLLILFSAGRLMREVLRVLMEGVPRDVNAQEVGGAMANVQGVRAVHDMHIWALSSKHYALAAHVDLNSVSAWADVLPRLQNLLSDKFNISHSTLQPEDAGIRSACATADDCGAASAGS